MNLTQKIIQAHLLEGALIPGEEISISIDQTLTQDSTGTMAYLQFEAMGIPRVKTKRSVAYIDHNTLQAGFENADDHKYIQSVTAKHGVYFSRPGNGICHQVHLERFGEPGLTLLGSDSHTPTGGALGMLAIGAGGLDVAVAMGGGGYYTLMPRVCRVTLKGKLAPWVSAKDIILALLQRLTVKGGVGKVMEYAGEGIKSLSVPQRATICNMGAELGATTSIFPSDETTRAFLKAQNREEGWQELKADENASYDEEIELDLSSLEPLAAMPHSPDRVTEISKLAGMKIDQVLIGSCTNSSYEDLMMTAAILKGKTAAPGVSLAIAPGSKQVLTMLAQNGALADMIAAGARILESACGPCIGMGQAPADKGISLRTFNRNFPGRSGTANAEVYLVSPETAAASAVAGVLADPRMLGDYTKIETPERFIVNDNMIIPPPADGSGVEVYRGPNIHPFPLKEELTDAIQAKALIKVGDNITTDDIMPSNAKLLPYRSNIPYLANYCLVPCDPDFPARAKAQGGGFIIGGDNYGQGSSREHAALAPVELGIKGVAAKSFARIHRANLINNGILPLEFLQEEDYEALEAGDELRLEGLHAYLQGNAQQPLMLQNLTQGKEIPVKLELSQRQANMILAGGLLNLTRKSKG